MDVRLSIGMKLEGWNVMEVDLGEVKSREMGGEYNQNTLWA